MKEAILYKKLNNKNTQCHLCNHFCLIKNNDLGKCWVRKNIDGVLFSLNYGKIIAEHIDPMEKKPLYHYLPGTFTYSIAAAGCNFRCRHCQNADISQIKNNPNLVGGKIMEKTAQNVVAEASKNNCPSISYTYTEPTIFAEFALACMKLAKKNGLKNIWVSNGYMSKECLEIIAPYLDAGNIDLKFFREKSYNEICGAKLKPVLDNLIWLKARKIHLEVTTLIIPTLNDSEKELSDIANFIYQKLGAETPWHVSAFYPAYRLINLPATRPDLVLKAQKIGQKAGLNYVYTGNI
ncbi:MAG: AmmeMemoRadiSam system radical SAM enzyme [Patescibacteria group bacterium]